MQYVSTYRAEFNLEMKWNSIALPSDFLIFMAEQIRMADGKHIEDASMEMDEQVVGDHVARIKLLNEYPNLVNIRSCNLMIEDCVMRYLFDSVLDHIVDHCKQLLNHSLMKNTKYIYLVGGFSSNSYLQQRVHYEFGHCSPFNTKVVTPRDPILCVVDGAARYGLNRDYICSRTLNRTYGVSIERELGEFKRLFPSIEIAKDQIRKTESSSWVQHCFFPYVGPETKFCTKTFSCSFSHRL